MTFRQSLSFSFKLILMAVVVYFLASQISSHWMEIRNHDWHFDLLWAVSSVLIGLMALFVMASNWKKLIAGFGHKITITKAFRIFYLSDLGRYIPGKIWPLMGILYLTHKEDIPPEQATASFVMIQLLAIPASFALFAIAVQLEPRILVEQVALLGEGTAWLFSGCLLVLIALVVLWPGGVLGLLNRVLVRFGRLPVEFQLDKKVALLLLVRYSFGWFLYGVAFYAFIRSVAPGAGLSAVAAVGVFNASYQIGYLALFAPGGFGPRELVMGFMLTPFVGPLASAVAILARLWAIVIEVSAALIALCIKK